MRLSFIAALVAAIYCSLPGAASAQMTGSGGATPPECEHPANQDLRDACHAAIASCFWTAGASAQAVNEDANAAIRKCVRKALGQSADDSYSVREQCVDAKDEDGHDKDRDEIIRACTAAINTRRGTAKEISTYYTNRGAALTQKYRYAFYAAAIADLTQAIEHDPQNGWAYLWRGVARCSSVQFTTGLGDLDKAVAILSHQSDTKGYALALHWRGVARRSIGRTAEGEKDLADARDIDPDIGN